MMLAQKTLEEVPGQVRNYFNRRGIVPNPSSEAERNKLRKKLSKVRSKKGKQPQEKEDFWSQKKAEFVQQLVN